MVKVQRLFAKTNLKIPISWVDNQLKLSTFYYIIVTRISNLSLRLILKFEPKYKHLDGYIEYAHLLLYRLNSV